MFSSSVVSNSLWPYGLWATRLLCPWDFLGTNIGVAISSLGDLPNLGIKSESPESPAFQADSFFFFSFYFIFKLDNIVLVLPNIEMNPPQVYLCSGRFFTTEPLAFTNLKCFEDDDDDDDDKIKWMGGNCYDTITCLWYRQQWWFQGGILISKLISCIH